MTPKPSLAFTIGLVLYAVFAGCYLLCRSYFGHSLNLLLIGEYFLLFAFLAFQICFVSHSAKIKAHYKAPLGFAVICEVFLGLYWPELSRVFFGLGGAIFLALSLKGMFLAVKEHLGLLVCIALGAVFYFAWANSYYSDWTGIEMPVLAQELAQMGILHKDFWYLSSMVSMIKNYDVLSIGVHGLTPTKAHGFLPYLFAALSKTYGISSILAVCLSGLVLLVPLAYFSIFNASLLVSKSKHLGGVVLSVAGLLFCLDALCQYYGMINYNFALSLVLLCPALVFLVQHSKFSWQNFIPLLLLSLVALVTLEIKPQAALFILLLALVRIFFSFTKPPYLALLLMVLIGGGALFLLPSDSMYYEYLTKLQPFNLNFKFPELSLFYLLAAALAFFIWRSKQDLRANLDLKALVSMVGILAFLIVVRGIPDGNLHYLSSALVVLSFLFLSKYFDSVSDRLNLKLALAALVCSVFFALALYKNIDTILLKVENAKDSKSLEILELISAGLEREKQRDFAVYVGPEQEQLWSLVQPCSSKPFLMPALFEVPRIYGMPSTDICKMSRAGYGYKALGDVRTRALSDPQLCNSVKDLGLKRVVALEYQGYLLSRKIECS